MRNTDSGSDDALKFIDLTSKNKTLTCDDTFDRPLKLNAKGLVLSQQI